MIDVSCRGVSKQYRLRRRPVLDNGRWTLAHAVSRLRRSSESFWALREVTFDVGRGETLAIIGRNGAGKSTLLKIIGGITPPSRGEIVISGRLAALIEVGSGFHPDLTGRENVFLSGAILGMRRREIAARLVRIAEFAGIGTFLDVPVKHYSSGMTVRLGFAVAAHLEPDILLVDEVLAVGDAEFQSRCLRRMQELRTRGTTMVIISHDLGAVERLSDRALLLQEGRVIASGIPSDVISRYHQLVKGEAVVERSAASGISIRDIGLSGPTGIESVSAVSGEPLVARVRLTVDQELGPVVVHLRFYTHHDGLLVTECAAGHGDRPLTPRVGDSDLEFVIPDLLLRPGVYTLGVAVRSAESGCALAWRYGRTSLYVEGRGELGGFMQLPYDWHVRTIVSGGDARVGATEQPRIAV
jgi:lipopolysaccharide transport system ATP-binding protein